LIKSRLLISIKWGFGFLLYLLSIHIFLNSCGIDSCELWKVLSVNGRVCRLSVGNDSFFSIKLLLFFGIEKLSLLLLLFNLNVLLWSNLCKWFRLCPQVKKSESTVLIWLLYWFNWFNVN
jgi:hypothetical protein